jgi:glycyl-tRNA synthetase beta chain
MDRELLIEIGVEEIPASWLPGLTTQVGTKLESRLKELRLAPAAPIETFSTPRRLTARIGKLAERQTDSEELLTGPPVSASFTPDGSPTPAADGFARKQGVEVAALERLETPRGTYLAFRKQLRGKAAVDVLPDVLSGLLRELSFPKSMRWDALLEDGKTDLPFGRPIRWILFLYGGRVVPFSLFRTAVAQGPLVQEVRSSAVTFGHRFLTTSGRAGRAIKVKGFDDYRRRLAENFVVLDRSERQDRITRELDIEARRRGGRIARHLVAQTLLQEVPDLVEYPTVISGAFGHEFLTLPEEVLTTTMIHHQHFFPVMNEQGRLQPVFLAVLNMEPDKPELIAKNLERVLTARLRDARFFWDADREKKLDAFVDRLGTLLFHKKLGNYADKADRVARLARWIAQDVFGADERTAALAETAGRLSKADLATDMVREMTDLQGLIGGIYAREDHQPEEVWKAIYFHYLPVAVEADAPPTRAQLGAAAVTWAAVALADKLDTVAGMFGAGERPTGSRDPYGLRRAAQGIARILIDLPELTGVDRAIPLGRLLSQAARNSGSWPQPDAAVHDFVLDRVRYVLEQRGFDGRNVRAVTSGDARELSPLQARRKLEVLPEFTESTEFKQLAVLFKRVKNIAKNFSGDANSATDGLLREPAERALVTEMDQRRPVIEAAVKSGQGYREAFAEASRFGPTVAKFFDDVLVMAEDPKLRDARLALLKRLEGLILQLADISEMVPEGPV